LGVETSVMSGGSGPAGAAGREDIAAEAKGTASATGDALKHAELIVSVLNEDVDRVHRLVLAALGLAAVFVTQIPLGDLRALPHGYRAVTVVAVGLLAIAAALLFRYTQKLNIKRLQLAEAAVRDPSHNIGKEWDPSFARWDPKRIEWVWQLTAGTLLLALGGILLGVVVGRLLLG
jgi:hypothetical protein